MQRAWTVGRRSWRLWRDMWLQQRSVAFWTVAPSSEMLILLFLEQLKSCHCFNLDFFMTHLSPLCTFYICTVTSQTGWMLTCYSVVVPASRPSFMSSEGQRVSVLNPRSMLCCVCCDNCSCFGFSLVLISTHSLSSGWSRFCVGSVLVLCLGCAESSCPSCDAADLLVWSITHLLHWKQVCV